VKTKIKELRARLEMTQQELADAVGATRMTIVFLEKGRYNPSLKLAAKIAKVLGSGIEDVFILEESDYSN
jgi:putative transcriptional regulator